MIQVALSLGCMAIGIDIRPGLLEPAKKRVDCARELAKAFCLKMGEVELATDALDNLGVNHFRRTDLVLCNNYVFHAKGQGTCASNSLPLTAQQTISALPSSFSPTPTNIRPLSL